MPTIVRRRKTYEERTRMNGRRAKAACLVFRSELGREYTTDSRGRKIRVFTAENWCGPEDVREWLLNSRVVDLDDALEHISKAVLKFLIEGQYIRKDPKATYYWVTAKAAEKYNLPPVLGCRFPN